MPIGGFVRTSFVDYPGKIATTIFLSRCNFHCPFCQNPELATDSGINPVEFSEIFNFLKQARHLVDAVCFSGGEATLDPQLKNYMLQVKELGLLVKLDTNGAEPDLLTTLPLDYVAMDLKTSLDKYPQLTKISHIETRIKTSIQILKQELPVKYEFRTTLVPGVTDPQDIRAIGLLIGKDPVWYLQQFRNTRCLDHRYQEVAPFTGDQTTELLVIARQYNANATLR